MTDPRSLALRILTQGQRQRTPTEPLLAPTLARSGLDARDRRLVTTLVQTTHRWRGRADRVLDARLSRGVRSLDVRTLNILRLAYVQLFHLDQIPPHAAVHTAVDLAWRGGGEGKARLVNKIMRGLLAHPPSPEEWRRGDGADALGGEYSHPVWLIERWLERWGDAATRRICEWNNAAPRFHLRVRGGSEAAAGVRAHLEADGFEVAAGQLLAEALWIGGTLNIHLHPLLTRGEVSVQDESQMLVTRLWPDPGASPMLDLCAAPGTKTSHAAELAPEALVVAADSAPRRAQRVRQTAARLKLPNIAVLVSDGRRPALRPVFQRVLVDAPCTSLGVLQRRPDARWLRSPGDVHDAAALQAQLMDAAAGLLLPGGWLLYSVCSLEKEETDDRVAAFLAAQPAFAAEALPDWVPNELRPAPGVLRVLPGTMGLEGVYAALFRRRS
jgi:16S rRNA (cytosine967-C5)-methyltransferase